MGQPARKLTAKDANEKLAHRRLMVLERAARETAVPSAAAERFPDWFIRMTKPGIDLDEAIDDNRTPHDPWRHEP